MFLVEIYNDNDKTGDPDFRLSTEYLAFDHPWDSGLVDIQGINYVVDSVQGGMIRAKYGALSFLPTIVAEDFIGVDIYYTNSDEASKLLLFSGVGYIKSRTRTLFSYDLFTDAPNVQIDADLGFTNGDYPTSGDGGDWDLIKIFQSYTDSVGWTLDSSQAASANIEVDFVANEGQLFADLLSNLCRTYGHYFLIDSANTTIHLREINSGVGTVEVFDEFQYFPSQYSFNIPPSKVTVGDQTAYGGTFYFGSAISLPAFSQSDVTNLALATKTNTLAEASPYDFKLYMPIEYFVDKQISFVTLNKIRWTETSVLFPDSVDTFDMVVHGLAFNVQQNKVVLTGYVTEVV